AETVELGCTQRAHAGAAEDLDALVQRPQDLLMPDRGCPAEIPVHDAHGPWSFKGRAIDVALGSRRQADGVADGRNLIVSQRRSDEYDDTRVGARIPAQGRHPWIARALAPGT